MKKINKIVITSLILCLAIIVGVFAVNKIKNNNSLNDDDEPEYVIDEEIVNDLKDNLGKGTNGDVTKVENTVDEDGNKQYIYTFVDGHTQTITVRHDDSPSFLDFENNKPEKDDQDEDTDNDPDVPEEHEESYGTVYERFLAMSSEEQYAFYETFESHDEYMEWYRKAQAEYQSLHPTIEVGDGDYIEYGD